MGQPARKSGCRRTGARQRLLDGLRGERDEVENNHRVVSVIRTSLASSGRPAPPLGRTYWPLTHVSDEPARLDVATILDTLNEHRVEYVVIGAWAV